MSTTIVIPNNVATIDELHLSSKVLKPFSDILIEFVNDVSKSILKNTALKEYPETDGTGFLDEKVTY